MVTKYSALAFYKLYAGTRFYKSGVAECTLGGKTYKLPYRVYYVSRLIPKWADGQTFGNYVFLRYGLTELGRELILDHELVHVCQFRRYAPWFPLLYLWASIRYGYWNNPFEEEARENAHEVKR